MTLDWQNLIVVAVVVAAGGYLARVGWQSIARRRAAACGGCGTCPAAGSEPEVVRISAGSRSPASSPPGAERGE